MKKSAPWVLLLAFGCGEGAPAPGPAAGTAAPSTAPAPAPVPTPPEAPTAQPRQDELYPLRLSILQGRLTPETVFYLHDPRMDPEGKLGERPHPLRDVYRPGGTYLMRFSRKGYKPVDVTVRLTPKGPEPPLETMPLEFEPSEELSGRYREAEEGLAAGDAKKARAALERVRELDERYLKTPELFRKLGELEERLERERKALEEATACLRRGDLEGAGKVGTLGPQIEEVRAAHARFDQCVARFDLKGAAAELTKLRETLTPADPSNRDRAGRMDDLKALRALLDLFEQICLEPQGAKERLADLWDKDRISRAQEIARDLERFTRYARYVSLRHELSSFALRGAEAEVGAILSARYALPAGESQAQEKTVVRLRKTDAWRMVDYREAK